MSGIYAIEHTKSGARYIGSSSDIRGRWLRHRSRLRRGRHHCDLLQTAWSINGESEFRLVVLEEVANIFQLTIREQAWLDQTDYPFNRIKSYNPNAV